MRLETSKDGTDYEEHQSVEVSARRELHCVRPIGPRTNFLRVTLEGEGECCLAELTLYDRRPTDEAAAPAPAPAPIAAPPASAPPPPKQAAAGPSDDVLWTVAQLGDHVQRCAAAVTTLQRQLAAVSERLVQGDARRAAEAEASAARERAHWDEMKAHVERWESRVVDEVLCRSCATCSTCCDASSAARTPRAATPPPPPRRRSRASTSSAATAAAPAAAPSRIAVRSSARGVPQDERCVG